MQTWGDASVGTENGRVDMIINQLTRMETKIDQLVRDIHDDVEAVHGRVNRLTERVSKTENKVSRIEGIGGALQVIWGALIAWVNSQSGGGGS